MRCRTTGSKREMKNASRSVMRRPALSAFQLFSRNEHQFSVPKDYGRPAHRDAQYMMLAPTHDPIVPAMMIPAMLKLAWPV